MKETTKIAGIGAACAACCALPLLASISMATTSNGLVAGGLLLVGLAAGGSRLRVARRRGGSAACRIDGRCGCGEGKQW